MFFEDVNVNFPQQPVFINDIELFNIPYGAGIYIKGAVTPIIIKGAKAGKILDFISDCFNRSKTLPEIFREERNDFSLEELILVLKKIHAYGLITDRKNIAREDLPASDSIRQKQLSYWGRKLGANGYLENPAQVQESLQRRSILLIGNDLLFATFLDTLAISGFSRIDAVEISYSGNSVVPDNFNCFVSTRRVSSGEDYHGLLTHLYDAVDNATFVILALRRYSQKLISDINNICIKKNVEFIPIYEDGSKIEVGPYIIPARSACYSCYDIRKRSIADVGLFDFIINSGPAFSFDESKLQGEDINSYRVVSSYVAIELTKIFSNYATSTLSNSVFRFDPVEGTFSSSSILKAANCTVCNLS